MKLRFDSSPGLPRRTSVALALLAATAALPASLPATQARANPLDLPGWDLVFNDEFEGTSVDTSKWLVMDRRDSFNNEKQYYHPDQVTVSGGNLVLTAIDTPRQGKAYQSGLIDSHEQWSLGRFEARIDLPTSQGMWPAFWLLPDTAQVPWPSGGEIDIMENRGSEPHGVSSAYHWGPDFFGREFVFSEYGARNPDGSPVNYHDSFHTYAVEWDPGVLRFYVDGVNYHTVTSAQAEIFDTAKSIILNLAVGGDFGGDPNGSTVWPQEMLVDYVRVWQRPEGFVPPVKVVLDNPGFDDAGGSLSSWTAFGDTGGNVSASSEASLNGGSALKLYGQFDGGINFSGVYQNIEVSEGDLVRAEASAFTPSWDSIEGTANQAVMKIEFYSVLDGEFGSAGYLGASSELLLNGSSLEDAWLDFMLEAEAPAGAAEARLVFLFAQPSNQGGAVWVDSALLGVVAPPTLPGDANADEVVDLLDFDVLSANFGFGAGGGQGRGDFNGDGFTNLLDFDILSANFGTAAAPATVPEPAGLTALVAGILAAARRRR
ncbi:MAG: family 16 glycosylhydrolase [Planctomycetota bacterium]